MANVFININQAIGAVAAGAAQLIATKIDAARENGCQLQKLKGWVELDLKGVNEGPVTFGVSVDCDIAQIAAAFAADPQVMNETQSSEEANRKVFPIASWGRDYTDPPDGEYLDKYWVDWDIPSWKVREGLAMDYFYFNHSTSPMTTGAQLRSHAFCKYKWLED